MVKFGSAVFGGQIGKDSDRNSGKQQLYIYLMLQRLMKRT
jgi:hypothetical protein